MRLQFLGNKAPMNNTGSSIIDLNNMTCQQFYNLQIDNSQYDYDNYSWIIWLRLNILLASSLALIINIAVILRRKQYKFNTVRLFMFVEVFYVVSLLSVSTHHAAYNSPSSTTLNYETLNTKYMIELIPMQNQDQTRTMYFDCLVETGSNFASAIQGLINLSSYAIAYWLAVCITLYVRHVLENTHKKFMRKRGPFIFLVSLGILIWYLVPFCLALIPGVPFSFGPTGYKFKSQSQLFFYGGLVNRSGSVGNILVIIWMLLLPLAMFSYHIYLLYFNWRAQSELLKLDEISPRQYFIIRSGKLSVVIFFVQFLNVGKLIFSIWKPEGEAVDFILLIVNILFDLMAFVLIYIYCRHYYKQGRILQERSQIMGSSLLSSFSNPAI